MLSTFSLVLGAAIALWCGWYCGRESAKKGRRRALWTVLGVVLNVVAVPVLLALPAAGGDPDRLAGDDAPEHGSHERPADGRPLT